MDSLRALGFKVPYLGNGPFWAMRDGNAMLKPFQHLGCSRFLRHDGDLTFDCERSVELKKRFQDAWFLF